MKKILMAILSLVFAFGLITSVSADCIVKEGDYIVFGRYNGEDILWRVIEETDEGYLLMTDKIISTSSFDDESSRWGTSDLRSWLNSSDGFLSDENFTQSELAILKSYTYKTALNDKYINQATLGSETHIYSSGMQGFFNNYDVAYADTLSDKVFIPSVGDIDNIMNNPRTLGVDFIMASPAESLYNASVESHPDMHLDGGWYYWLRDAMYGTGNNVRAVYPDGRVNYENILTECIGVRPVCHVNKNTLGISSGDGSKANPYRISDVSYIIIYTDSNYGIADKDVNVYMSTNASQEYSVKLYHNGTVAVENAFDVCTLPLDVEDNTFYAEMLDADGNVVATSESVIVYGLSYTTIKNVVNYDFEEKQYYSNCEWIDEGGEHGKFIVLAAPAKTNMQIGLGQFLMDKPCAYVDVDLRFDTMNSGEKAPFYIMAQPINKFIRPVIVDKSGYLRINDVESGGGTVMKLEEGRWYNFKLIVNDKANTITIAVDNVVVCRDAKVAFDFEYTQRMNISNLNYGSSIENRMCVDNLHVASADENITDYRLRLYDAGNNKTQVILVNNTDSKLTAELVLCAYSKSDDSVLDVAIVPVELNSGGILNSTYKMNYTKSEDTYLKGILIRSFADLEPLLESAVTE